MIGCYLLVLNVLFLIHHYLSCKMQIFDFIQNFSIYFLGIEVAWIYFPVKDLGPLLFLLGIEVARITSGFFLLQSKYISDLLHCTNIHNSKSISTTISIIEKLTALDGCTFEYLQCYRSVVDSIQYLIFTRPDISFVMNRVCQYMHHPCLPYWQTVKCILCYFNHIRHLRLYFSLNSSFTLFAFFDIDWAGCHDDRKFTGSCRVYSGQHLILRNSKKKKSPPLLDHLLNLNTNLSLIFSYNLY